jgi:NAD-dependent deacetylase
MNQLLWEKIQESRYIVFFGGAGVSTESGVPDFRSADGLYHQKYAYPPEVILSHSFFNHNTEEFYRFYRDKMLYTEAEPNPAHKALAKLEEMGKLKAVITQNIDGLHQKAGSKCVLELHGSVHRNHCQSCGKFYGLDNILASVGVPRCTCGGIIKPDVVLYEEPLDDKVVHQAVRYIQKADLLVVGGTSLSVYPAAGFIQYLRNGKMAVINRDPTPADSRADLVLREPIGQVLSIDEQI